MTAAAFHPTLKAWLRVADTAFPASAYGVSGGGGGSFAAGAAGRGELEALQVAAAGAGPPGTLAPMLARGSAADQSRAHLEANLASAAALGSPTEYRGWLLAYAGHLAAAGDGGRLREVCDELLGPAGYGNGGGDGGPPSSAWAPVFLGLGKRDLLRTVLGVVGKQRALQRFAAEFTALLEQAA
jgi:protein HIRA/HIR1